MWYGKMLKANKNGISREELNIPLSGALQQILQTLVQNGWRGLVVGGAVRDAVTGHVPKDIDVEVYGPDFKQLAAVLKQYGHVLGGAADESVDDNSYQEFVPIPYFPEKFRDSQPSQMSSDGPIPNQGWMYNLNPKPQKSPVIGKAFGVIKFRDAEGNDYDFSLPRRDSKTGEGHTGFDIQVDPNMSPLEAASRRDFTFNCFSSETRMLTKAGIFSFSELVEQYVDVLNQNGEWVNALIRACGQQPLMKLILQRNGVKKEIFVTPNHRWFVRNKHTGNYTSVRTTEELKKCHFISSVFPKNISKDVIPNNDAICRGFVFGDGSLTYGSRNIASVANFCGEKDKNLLPCFSKLPVGCSPREYPGVIKIQGLPFEWKAHVPDLEHEDTSYLYGWLAGYFAADGCVDKKGCPTLSSASLENIEYVKMLCQKLGIGTLHTSVSHGGAGAYKPDSVCYILAFVRSTLCPEFFVIPEHRKRFVSHQYNRERTGWSVVSVEETDRYEEVFCAEVPIDHAFVLEHNVLTSNSLAYDPLTNELHDYFGGKKDLDNRILRATDMEKFGEDPLRVLRGMQFAARMGLTVDPQTAKLAQNLANEIPNLYKSPENPNGISRERVTEEFMKLATKGKFPGSAIQYLQDTGWVKYFPQVQAIIDVPQDEEWHPEGAVHIHTAHVMNAAAEIADRRGLKGDDRAVAIFAALGHDFAKATTTEQREKGGRMRWTAHGHEEAGGPVVKEFLQSIGVKNDIINRVVPLVRKHLNHIQYKDENISKGTVRGLSHDIYPATIEDLVDLIEADHSGRPPLEKMLPEQAQWLLDAAKKDNVHNQKPQQVITGKHVLPWFQGKVGPHVGKAVKEAYEAYLKGRYTTPEEAEVWLRNYMKANAQLLRGDDVLPYFGGKGGAQVGQILDKAWDAQSAGEYTDQDAARAWLENYMKTNPSA
jgi:tRNA nucleotidyltransferase (CCA-adding enzyme)